METSRRFPTAQRAVDSPASEPLLVTFYTTERCGAVRLSDGGGPFGFDITVAVQVDALVETYACDGIIETGTFLGDTTAYLARRYPSLPVRSIEIDEASAAFASRRLRDLPNCQVVCGDSADLLAKLVDGLERPLVYLDAHWEDAWPLREELRSVQRGIVGIDDFDIGHPRFGFDVYDGSACGVDLVAEALPEVDELYLGNPFADYGVPCLQVGRRTGTAYLCRGLDPAPMRSSPWFVRVPMTGGEPTLPTWGEGAGFS